MRVRICCIALFISYACAIHSWSVERTTGHWTDSCICGQDTEATDGRCACKHMMTRVCVRDHSARELARDPRAPRASDRAHPGATRPAWVHEDDTVRLPPIRKARHRDTSHGRTTAGGGGGGRAAAVILFPACTSTAVGTVHPATSARRREEERRRGGGGRGLGGCVSAGRGRRRSGLEVGRLGRWSSSSRPHITPGFPVFVDILLCTP